MAGQGSSLTTALDALEPPLGSAGLAHCLAHGQLYLGPLADQRACLSPTDVIDCQHPVIVGLAKEIVGKEALPREQVRRIFRWVRDNVRYDIGPSLTSRADWRASLTVRRGDGFCQQKSVLLVALLRAAGFPSGLVFQHLRDWKIVGTRYESLLPDGVILYHGLAAVWLDGWRKLDATLDAALCTRRRYQLVQVPQEGDAGLPARDLDGGRHFDVLGESGPYADLPRPVSDLLAGLKDTWAEARRMSISGLTM